jgi:ribose transport system permease protein
VEDRPDLVTICTQEAAWFRPIQRSLDRHMAAAQMQRRDAVVGLVNGVGVTLLLRVPPIIMTLGMSTIVEGALLLYTNGGSGGNAPAGDVYLATHRWGPLPVVGLVWIAVLAVATLVSPRHAVRPAALRHRAVQAGERVCRG